MQSDELCIGSRKEQLDTPILMIDLDVMESNIAGMAEYIKGVDAELRPHAKTHKTPMLAHKQIEAGAIGVTCAKVGEAEVMVAAGIKDILIANEIVPHQKIARLVNLAKHADMIDPMNDYQRAGFNPMSIPYVDNGLAIVNKDNADDFYWDKYLKRRGTKGINE